MTWGLVLAFDTDDAEFARGVEVGTVWGTLQQLDPSQPYQVTVHGTNAEMLLRIAESTGRPVTTQDHDDNWAVATFGPRRP